MAQHAFILGPSAPHCPRPHPPTAAPAPVPLLRYKAYLDDFAAYCSQLGGTTAEVMTDLLAFEVRTGVRRRVWRVWWGWVVAQLLGARN